jgi:hypothetical protein
VIETLFSIAGFSPRNCKESDMSANSKKSLGSTILLIFLGVAALVGGAKWLVLLVPAALLVWYGAGPILRGGRN